MSPTPPSTTASCSTASFPQPPLGYVKKGETDMYSPYEGEIPVGPLQPQETRKLVFQTRYFSPSAFSTTSRSFYTDPLVPFLGRSSGPTKISPGELGRPRDVVGSLLLEPQLIRGLRPRPPAGGSILTLPPGTNWCS